jgi:hypothetical protein
VPILQFKSSPHLPTLDALDAVFGREDEQCAAGCKRQGGAPMDSRFSPPQSKVPTHLGAARPALDAMTRSAANSIRPSLGKRASRRLARFLIMFGLAVVWGCGQSNDRKLVAAAWLVGTTNRTHCTDHSRRRGAGRSRHCFSGRATACAATRLDAPKRGPARSGACGRSAAGGRGHRQIAGGRAGNSSEALSDSAAFGRCPSA